MEIKVLLTRIKTAIAECMGNDRLKGVFLFGSEARSCSTESSDIDILVLLEGPVHHGLDLQEVISATYSIQLEIDKFLHFVLADVEDYNAGDYALYRIVKSEGVAA